MDDDLDWSTVKDSYGDATEVPTILEDLVHASTRSSASEAAWRLQERVTDQGAAVSEAAVPVVAALLRALEREDSPSWLEAEVLSVLDAISRPVGMWQRSFQRSNGKPSYAQGVEWEAAIIERLRPARRRIAALLGSSDPEVRAMASELLADVPLRAEEDLQQLKQLFDRDTDPLVRACVAEAVVRAATRSGDPVIISDAMDWARPKLRDAEPVVRFRTARALASTEETMVESAREVMEADAAVAQQIVWPSEV